MIQTGPTQTVLFVDLLKDASTRANTKLTENQESYAVFMLMGYMRKCELLSASLALSYLESFLETPRMQEVLLTDTADASLLLAGLFPERAKKMNVTSSYFLQMSKMCFMGLSDVCSRLKHKGEADLYLEIGSNVEKMAYVLYCMRQSNSASPEIVRLQPHHILH